MMNRFFSALLLSAFFVTPAFADSQKFVFDTAHTQIIFSASHLGFSQSHGKFLKFDGGFTFDETNPESAKVNVTIDTNSVDMGMDKWDESMKTKFFMSDKHPAIIFASTKVTKNGDKTATLDGDLTMLGITKPVSLNVTFNGCGDNPFSKQKVCGFSAIGTLKRSEWGMEYGLPLVGDDVTLSIQVEGNPEHKMNE